MANQVLALSVRGEVFESWAHEAPYPAEIVLAPILAFPDGRQLSAWALNSDQDSVDGIYARISGPGGWPEARRLESPPTIPQAELTAQVLSDSVFALAYPDGERSGVWVQQFDREGKAVRSSHLAGGSERVFAPTLAPLSTGGFLVIWTEHIGTTSYLAGRRLDGEGNPFGGLITWTSSRMNGNWPPRRPMAKPFPGGRILVVVPDHSSWALLLDEEGKVLEEPDLKALEQDQDLYIDPARGRILAIGKGETVVLLDLSMKVRDYRSLPFGIWPFGTGLCETLAGHIVLVFEPDKTGLRVNTNFELLRIEGF